MKLASVCVGDVLHLQRRPVDVDPALEYREIGVRSFGKGLFHKESVSGVDLGSKRVFRIEPGDLVISNVFAWEGAIALASRAEAGMIGSHRFMTYVPKDDRIDISWAGWFFLSEPGLELIRVASPGSAGRNKTLAIDRFESLRIALPPIAEQRSVAAKLGSIALALDALHASAHRSRLLSQAAHASLTLRPEGVHAGWRRVRADEALALRRVEIKVDPEGVYPMAGVYSFGRGLFSRADLQGSSTSYRVLHRLHPGQLVMSRLKAWEGALAVVPPEFDGHFLSPEFPTFDIDPDVADPSFLGALLTSESFWGRLKGSSKGIGARKERVHAERLLEQEFELPPLEEQRQRAASMRLVQDVRCLADDRRDRLDVVLPAALNRAFAGVS